MNALPFLFRAVYTLNPMCLVVFRPQPPLSCAIVRFQGSSMGLWPPLGG
jgi:hypothetical protein